MFTLEKLPYHRDALEPHISKETLDYHYGKHHQTYVSNLNNLTAGAGLDNQDLEKIITDSKGGLFNNAAQVFNHNFYWKSLSPNGGWKPTGDMLTAIEKNFDSFDLFKEAFTNAAIGNFASGWTWLVKTPTGKLEIVSTDDAQTVIGTDNVPLLVIDVWEHAYYIDYRNVRPDYITAFWNLVNWEFAETNMK